MTTRTISLSIGGRAVVEAYRLDRYDNLTIARGCPHADYVVEAYRLDRYDNSYPTREVLPSQQL